MTPADLQSKSNPPQIRNENLSAGTKREDRQKTATEGSPELVEGKTEDKKSD